MLTKEPLKRQQLPTFTEKVTKTKVKLKDKVKTLTEERRLLTRFVLASRNH